MLDAQTRARCSGVRCTSQEPEQVDATGADGAVEYAVEAFADTFLDGD